MSARKPSPAATETSISTAVPISRDRKKDRSPRVRLTHFEIRRGESLRLRIAIADDAIAEVGDELGALIKRIAPSTRTAVVPPPEPEFEADEFMISPRHANHDDNYHADLRAHLVELLGSLCDASLADALEIAREEQARRDEGEN